MSTFSAHTTREWEVELEVQVEVEVQSLGKVNVRKARGRWPMHKRLSEGVDERGCEKE
jgi:hypothetical protein